jgi:hypothetical protein
MLSYSKFLLWFVVTLAFASALWVLSVEITYERNVRHIPTNFRLHHKGPVCLWKA